MITGDHKITAAAIAERIGILEEDDLAISGPELDDMTEDELGHRWNPSVYMPGYPRNIKSELSVRGRRRGTL